MATARRIEEHVAKPSDVRLAGIDPARRAAILKREKEEGCVIDALTGYPMKMDRRDREVEWLPDMTFWVDLDRELIGGRNENGFIIPSEVFGALDRWGIHNQDNRETAKLMLDLIATGRNKAAIEKMEKGA